MAGTLSYNQTEQWILFKTLNNILHYHKDDKFSNFIQITSQNPELMFNRIFACNPETAQFYMSLTPLQRSFMQPQVRLFRQLPDGSEREISFASSFNALEFNELAKGKLDSIQDHGRLDGSALKRISISEKPERPTDVNLQCKIELFFDNIHALFNTNVLELITTPVRREKFDSKDYRIKMMLGWNVPHDSSGFQFTSDQKRIISESNVVYLLELTQHNLNFRENGSLDITIDYVGAIESQMKSQQSYDLFKIDVFKDEFRGEFKDTTGFFEDLAIAVATLPTKAFVPDQTPEQQKGLEAFAKADTIGRYTALTIEKESLTKKLDDIAQKQLNQGPGAIKTTKDDTVELIQKRLGEIDAELADIDVLILREKYVKILDYTARSNRIFYIPVRPEVFVNLGTMGNGNSPVINAIEGLDQATPQQLIFDPNDPANTAYNEYVKQYKLRKEVSEDTAKARNQDDLDDVDEPDDGFSLVREVQAKNVNIAYRKKEYAIPFENFNVYYILLGDLINIVTFLSGNNKVNIVLGPFRFGDKIINLAQLPIALSQFSNFFVNKVIKIAKKSYYLWDFIQDVVTDLIVPQLAGNNFTLPAMPNLNITNTTVLSPTPLEPGTVYPDDRLANSLSRGYLQGQTPYPYLVIYCRSFDLPYRDGNPVQDAKDGIYHFGIGRNVGVVKNISFSKIDQPKLRDARLTGDELNRAGKVLREHYNCRMAMIGNPMFIPGAHFYFDGSYLGERGRQATDIIGLGGYYMINGIESVFTPGKYDMQIDGFWQTIADKKPAEADVVSADVAQEAVAFNKLQVYKINTSIGKL